MIFFITRTVGVDTHESSKDLITLLLLITPLSAFLQLVAALPSVTCAGFIKGLVHHPDLPARIPMDITQALYCSSYRTAGEYILSDQSAVSRLLRHGPGPKAFPVGTTNRLREVRIRAVKHHHPLSPTTVRSTSPARKHDCISALAAAFTLEGLYHVH